MDLFIKKLESYGLEVSKGDGSEKKVSTIEKELVEYGELKSAKLITEKIILNKIYIKIKNKNLFTEKVGFGKLMRERPSFVLENVCLEVHRGKNCLYLADFECDLGKYNREEIMKHIEENEKRYGFLYPEWKMKRIFDKKADKEFIKLLHKERRDFIDRETDEKSFKNLYDELIGTIEIMIKQKNAN